MYEISVHKEYNYSGNPVNVRICAAYADTTMSGYDYY